MSNQPLVLMYSRFINPARRPSVLYGQIMWTPGRHTHIVPKLFCWVGREQVNSRFYASVRNYLIGCTQIIVSKNNHDLIPGATQNKTSCVSLYTASSSRCRTDNPCSLGFPNQWWPTLIFVRGLDFGIRQPSNIYSFVVLRCGTRDLNEAMYAGQVSYVVLFPLKSCIVFHCEIWLTWLTLQNWSKMWTF